MTLVVDRTHHCQATRGELRCTLHRGHREGHPDGAHYDSLLGEAFDVDVPAPNDTPRTLRTGTASGLLAAIALALVLTSCSSSNPASGPGAADAAADTAIEPELDVAADKACWHQGQSCTSTAHCCAPLVCTLDLCQPCPGWMC